MHCASRTSAETIQHLLSNQDQILIDSRYTQRNHLRKFRWQVTGYTRSGGGQILPTPIDYHRHPTNGHMRGEWSLP